MFRHYILLSPSFVSLFWAITLLTQQRTNNRSQNLWSIASFVMAISTYIWGVLFAGVNDYHLFYKLELVEAFSTLLLLPLLYFCFRTLTEEAKIRWHEYLCFLPALLIGGSMFGLYIWMGEENAVNYILEITTHQGKLVTLTAPVYQALNFISGYVYTIVVFAQIIFLLFFATIHIRRYHYRLNDYYSNREGKSIENGIALVVILYLILTLSLITYRGRFYYDESSAVPLILMLIWTVLIYFTGYNVYHLKYTVDTFALELGTSEQEAAEQLRTGTTTDTELINEGIEFIDRIKEKLLPDLVRLMNEKKVFLNNDLRLEEVARMLRSNRTYTSLVIRDEYDCNFSDYINKQRIAYAQELVRNKPHLSQEQIAEASGFKYVSTFSRTFKQHTGITFRDFSKAFSGK